MWTWTGAAVWLSTRRTGPPVIWREDEMKRITAVIEVTYPADDPRDLEKLKGEVRDAVLAGLDGPGSDSGTLAAYAVIHAALDPVREPLADDIRPPAQVEPQ